MNDSLELEIGRFHRWREDLVAAVNEYREWLEHTGQLDMHQSIRFYDLLEDLKHGRVMLAFIAEFSRGKSELINALFFSSFQQRLLPSDLGRTTMCPTEIFHDPSEQPYIRLLPIETRYRDESIAQLKNMPVEWSTIRLNLDSPDSIRQAMLALAEVRKVYPLEARMMGLLSEDHGVEGAAAVSDKEKIEIPAWRYALINFPHPLLSKGLAILDTPGLNALGLEPELTLSTLPNAHAALFLLGVDTGVTRSDMEVWQRYVKHSIETRIAVLNKIDLVWDELKSWDEIRVSLERQREATARLLDLPLDRVLTISAQKALVGRIRKDAALVEISGIGKLETLLAREIIPARREIVIRSVTNELGAMMEVTAGSVRSRLQANYNAAIELNELSGKSKDIVARLWRKISKDKEDYTAALTEYKAVRTLFQVKHNALSDRLNPARLDEMLMQSRVGLDKTWTTVGLSNAMNQLIVSIGTEFDRIQAMSEDAHNLMKRAYANFQQKFHFELVELRQLNLEMHRLKLQLLQRETERFCRDPVNVATPKGFLIKKFYDSLVLQARKIFRDARTECERWMRAVPLPLENQLRDHKNQLQQRLESLAKINDNTASIQDRLTRLRTDQVDLIKQRDMLSRLADRLRTSEPEAEAA
jgi:hypothetical protein